MCTIVSSNFKRVQVLGMIVDAMDTNHDGYINYHEFIGSIRFNKIPFK